MTPSRPWWSYLLFWRKKEPSVFLKCLAVHMHYASNNRSAFK